MPREVEISNIERNFILEALEQRVRLDGRSLGQFRNIDLEFGDEYGTVTLRLGKTRSVVSCIRPFVLLKTYTGFLCRCLQKSPNRRKSENLTGYSPLLRS